VERIYEGDERKCEIIIVARKDPKRAVLQYLPFTIEVQREAAKISLIREKRGLTN